MMSLFRPLLQRLASPFQYAAMRSWLPQTPQQNFFHTTTGLINSLLGRRLENPLMLNSGNFNLVATREMNRNARRPKKANHGKRPVSHARRRARRFALKSRAYREKIFGFW